MKYQVIKQPARADTVNWKIYYKLLKAPAMFSKLSMGNQPSNWKCLGLVGKWVKVAENKTKGLQQGLVDEGSSKCQERDTRGTLSFTICPVTTLCWLISHILLNHQTLNKHHSDGSVSLAVMPRGSSVSACHGRPGGTPNSILTADKCSQWLQGSLCLTLRKLTLAREYSREINNCHDKMHITNQNWTSLELCSDLP